MGSQRIVSKLSNSGIFEASPVTVTDQQARYALQSHKIKERFDSLGVVYKGTPQTGGLVSVNPASTASEYFYHSDHLGSSSLITDGTGALTQHIQYVPFGEVFVEERTNSWSTPYKFNGKELDEETGLYYYHARYYDPRLSVWMSVDPLAEKYPNVGSYVYCKNSPVMRIDPDGRDDFEINSTGKIINRIENKDRDAFFIVELNEEGDYNRTGQHIEFEYKTVKVSPKFKGYDVYEVKQKDKGVKLFEFFADNTKVEWGMVKYLNNNVTITTSHCERSLKGNVGELIKELKLVGSVESITHSHPGGTPYPSGLDSKKSDIGAAKAYEERYGNVLLYIYLPGIDKGVRENYIKYNSQSLPIDFKGHPANKNLPAEFIIRPTKK